MTHTEMPFAGTVDCPTTVNRGMVTGCWKMKRPVQNRDLCTECLNCWIVCPDACITQTDDGLTWNYEFCKGCGLCGQECPVGAITYVPELEFKD